MNVICMTVLGALAIIASAYLFATGHDGSSVVVIGSVAAAGIAGVSTPKYAVTENPLVSQGQADLP